MTTCPEAITTNKLTASQALQMHEEHYESLESTKRRRRVEALLDDPKVAEPVIDLIDEKLVEMTMRNGSKVLTFHLVMPYEDTRKLLIDFDCGGEPIDYFEMPAVKNLLADNDVDANGQEMYWFVERLFNGRMWEYIREEYSKRGFNTSWRSTRKPNRLLEEGGYAGYRIDYVNPTDTDANREHFLEKLAEPVNPKKKKSLFERIFER